MKDMEEYKREIRQKPLGSLVDELITVRLEGKKESVQEQIQQTQKKGALIKEINRRGYAKVLGTTERPKHVKTLGKLV